MPSPKAPFPAMKHPWCPPKRDSPAPPRTRCGRWGGRTRGVTGMAPHPSSCWRTPLSQASLITLEEQPGDGPTRAITKHHPKNHPWGSSSKHIAQHHPSHQNNQPSPAFPASSALCSLKKALLEMHLSPHYCLLARALQ